MTLPPDRPGATAPSSEIRPARPDDRGAVLALMPRLEAFGLPANIAAGTLAAGETRALAGAFDRMPDGHALYVAVDPSGTIIGALYLETREDYFTSVRHGHVGVLAVAEAAEGRGVGRALLATADAWARAAGFDRLTLSVFDSNVRARSLYERAGYAVDLVRYRKDVGTGS